jgi:hypothetical protein
MPGHLPGFDGDDIAPSAEQRRSAPTLPQLERKRVAMHVDCIGHFRPLSVF